MDQVITAVDFEHPWAQVIGALKFQQKPAMADTLIKLMCREITDQQIHKPDLIVPIPLSSQRWRERGYNQAWILATHIATELGWQNRLCHQTLTRSMDTGRLMKMEADQRQARIKNAFRISSNWLHKVEGQHVTLVDDVMTTGATANEAARTLYAAGAATVTGWFAARTPAPERRSNAAKCM